MYDLYIMRRTQIYIDERQGERLSRLAAAEDTTLSALIRRAIDSYLAGDEPDRMRTERFRAALGEAAGSAPDLPGGEEYVEALRADYAERGRELWGARE